MKVRTLARSLDEHQRPKAQDRQPLHRNLDPDLHPFERAREYTRALQATKLDRLFAKPFVAALEGHIDGVYCIARDPWKVGRIASGSGDGEIKMWDLARQEAVITRKAHQGIVRSIAFDHQNSRLLTCSSDRTIKVWNTRQDGQETEMSTAPLLTYQEDDPVNAVDHHFQRPLFASAASIVKLWDSSRVSTPTRLEWLGAVDTITALKFSPIECDVLASAGTDRSIILYDVRAPTPVSRVVLKMRTNAIAWHPLFANTMACASDDTNVYVFDIRFMASPSTAKTVKSGKSFSASNILKDHVAAVMDLEYSPTGADLVTGSYDRTIRVFPASASASTTGVSSTAQATGRSRDVYHTRRMQRIFSVRFSSDARFILSGSDEGNIRIWKANASGLDSRLGVRSRAERSAMEYNQTIQDRYANMPEIRRIRRHRHVPHAIKSATAKKRVIETSEKRKEDNRRRHAKDNGGDRVPERRAIILKQDQ